ncbi:MAG: hypothetical protein K0U41_08115, partial [Gammaproteobacteria bacterium]|nr:hypothetical protein [Gammaproteobacteria bacterium]
MIRFIKMPWNRTLFVFVFTIFLSACGEESFVVSIDRSPAPPVVDLQAVSTVISEANVSWINPDYRASIDNVTITYNGYDLARGGSPVNGSEGGVFLNAVDDNPLFTRDASVNYNIAGLNQTAYYEFTVTLGYTDVMAMPATSSRTSIARAPAPAVASLNATSTVISEANLSWINPTYPVPINNVTITYSGYDLARGGSPVNGSEGRVFLNSANGNQFVTRGAPVSRNISGLDQAAYYEFTVTLGYLDLAEMPASRSRARINVTSPQAMIGLTANSTVIGEATLSWASPKHPVPISNVTIAYSGYDFASGGDPVDSGTALINDMDRVALTMRNTPIEYSVAGLDQAVYYNFTVTIEYLNLAETTSASSTRILIARSAAPGVASLNAISTVISEANLSWINPTYPVSINNITITYSGYDLASGGSPVANSTGEVFLNASDGNQFVMQGIPVRYDITGLDQAAYYEFIITLGYIGLTDARLSRVRIPISRSDPPATTGLVAISNSQAEATLSWDNPDYLVPISDISITYNAYDLANSGNLVDSGTALINDVDRAALTIRNTPIEYNLTGLDQSAYYNFTVTIAYLNLAEVTVAKSISRIPIAPPSFICSVPIATNLTDQDGDFCSDSEDVDADGDGLIEIKNAAELDSIRHNLFGTNLTSTPGGVGNAKGCPLVGAFPGQPKCSGYELAADIDLAAAGYTNWEPISSCLIGNARECMPAADSTFFATVLEGNNHTISNMHIRLTIHSQGTGLFGAADSNAELRNLHIRDGRITADLGFSHNHVGMLVGHLAGGRIDSSSVALGSINLPARAQVNPGSGQPPIQAADGGVRVGALVGWATANAIINSSTARGVQITAGNTIGGLVGRGEEITIVSSNATFDEMLGEASVGGLVGDSSGMTIVSSNATFDEIRGEANLGGLVGGGSRGVITIVSSNATFGKIRGESGLGGLIGSTQRPRITYSSATGASINGDVSIGGLIGFSSGSIIESSTATLGIINGSQAVGGLVGEDIISITITSSYAKVDKIIGRDSGSFFGTITGTSVGGLVGSGSSSNIRASYAIVNEIRGPSVLGGLIGFGAGATISSSMATVGEFNGNEIIGGLSGAGDRRTRIHSSYAITGVINGLSSLGGLVGNNIIGNVQNSFWDDKVYFPSGRQLTNIGTSKTTAELQTPTSFANGSIYALWANSYCNPITGDYRESPATGYIQSWDLGSSAEYPVVTCKRDFSPAQQREAIVASTRFSMNLYPAPAVEDLQAVSTIINEANVSWINPTYPVPINNITITYSGYDLAVGGNLIANSRGEVFLSATDGMQFVTRGLPVSRNIPNLDQATYYNFTITLGYLGLTDMPASSIRILINVTAPPTTIALIADSNATNEATLFWNNSDYLAPISNVTIAYSGYDFASGGDPVASGTALIKDMDRAALTMRNTPIAYNVTGLNQAAYYNFTVTISYLNLAETTVASSARIPIIRGAAPAVESLQAVSTIINEAKISWTNPTYPVPINNVTITYSGYDLAMGGSPIAGSSGTVFLNASDGDQFVMQGAPVIYDITGLNPATYYEFTVSLGYRGLTELQASSIRILMYRDPAPRVESLQASSTVISEANISWINPTYPTSINNVTITYSGYDLAMGGSPVTGSSGEVFLNASDGDQFVMQGASVNYNIGGLDQAAYYEFTVTLGYFGLADMPASSIRILINVTAPPTTIELIADSNATNEATLFWTNSDYLVPISNVTIAYSGYDFASGGDPVVSGTALINDMDRAILTMRNTPIAYNVTGLDQAAYYNFTLTISYLNLAETTVANSTRIPIIRGVAPGVESLNAVSTIISEANISWRNPIYSVPINNVTITYSGYDFASGGNPVANSTGVVFLNASDGEQFVKRGASANYNITGLNQTAYYEFVVTLGYLGLTETPASSTRILMYRDPAPRVESLQAVSAVISEANISWINPTYLVPINNVTITYSGYDLAIGGSPVANSTGEVFLNASDGEQFVKRGAPVIYDITGLNQTAYYEFVVTLGYLGLTETPASSIRIPIARGSAPAVASLNAISAVISEANISWINPIYPVPINNVTITYSGYDLAIGGSPVASSTGEVFISAADGNQFVTRGFPASYNIAGLNQTAYYELTVTLGYFGLTEMPASSIRIPINITAPPATIELIAKSNATSEATLFWTNPEYLVPISNVAITYNGYDFTSGGDPVDSGTALINGTDRAALTMRNTSIEYNVTGLDQAAYYNFTLTLTYLNLAETTVASSNRIPIALGVAPGAASLQAVSTIISEANISWINPFYPVPINNVTITYSGYDFASGGNPVANSTGEVFLNISDGNQFVKRGASVNYNIAGLNQTAYYEFVVTLGYRGLTEMPASSIRTPIARNPAPAVASLNAISTIISEANISWMNPTYPVPINNVTITYSGYNFVSGGNPVANSTGEVFLNASDGEQFVKQGASANYNIGNLNQTAYYEFVVTLGYLGLTDMPASSIRIPIARSSAPAVASLNAVSTIISEANISWINPTYQVPINNVTIIYSGYNLAIGGSPVANSTGEVFLNASDGEQFVRRGLAANYDLAGLNQTAYYEFTVSLGYLGLTEMPTSSIRIPIALGVAPAVASLNAVSTVISEANISWINPTYQAPINNITITYSGYDFASGGNPVANSTGEVFLNTSDGEQF